jgi:hypothetical protein
MLQCTIFELMSGRSDEPHGGSVRRFNVGNGLPPAQGPRVMTEVTVTKTKAARPAATMVPLFELPKFDMPKMDVPEGMREFAEKGVAQAREVYDKFKATAEEATRILEDANGTFAKAVA